MIAPLVFGIAAATLPGEGFQPIEKRGEITVYRSPHAAVLTLGAEGRIDAPPAVVRAALLDYPSQSGWVKNVAESRVVASGSDWLDVYQRLRLPVVNDRDFTVHVVWGGDRDAPWVRFQAANERGPGPRPGLVRVSVNRGSWRLRAIEGGRATWAIYELTFDPGGSIPSWLGRGRAAAEIFTLFEHLTREAKRRAP
jgi:hypothetical protein